MTRQGCVGAPIYQPTSDQLHAGTEEEQHASTSCFFSLVFVGRRKSTFCYLSLWHCCSLWVERNPLLSLPVREVLTVGVSDGQEAPSGPTLFSRRTCTLAARYPGLVCWDALPCPLLGSPLSCSSEPCHFLSLEKQRGGAGSQGLQRSRGSPSGVSLQEMKKVSHPQGTQAGAVTCFPLQPAALCFSLSFISRQWFSCVVFPPRPEARRAGACDISWCTARDCGSVLLPRRTAQDPSSPLAQPSPQDLLFPGEAR